jgi:GT2 family glycosyltransferase
LDWLRAWLRGDANKWTHLLRWPHAWRKRDPRFIWRGIKGCNLAFWRSDYVEADGFDEAFNGWGHEDADMVLRMHAKGLQRINGYASTEVFHLWHRQNPRADEAANRQRVLDRQATGQVRSDTGLQARQTAVLDSADMVTKSILLS